MLRAIKRLFILIGLVSTLTFFGIQPSQSQDEPSTAPYLYYYSPDYQAFIIERADGTEPRLLGDGLLPTFSGTKNEIEQAEWSPSGEWLAWVVSVHPLAVYNGIPLYQNAAIIRSDGSQILSAFANYDAVTMAWSPVEDVLFVVTEKTDIREEPIDGPDDESPYVTDVEMQFLMIDVATGDIQTIYELIDSFENALYTGSGFFIQWTPDGEQIAVTLGLSDYGWLIDRNGDLSEFSTSQRSIGVLSPTFRRIYSENDQFWVESVLDQSRFASDPIPANRVIWTDDGNYAILYEDREQGVWLLSVPESEITLIDDHIEIDFESYDYFYSPQPTLWSPQGNHVVLPTEKGELFHFDRVAHTVELLDDIVGLDSSGYWNWLSDERLAISGRRSEEAIITIYDLTSGDVETIHVLDKIPEQPFPIRAGFLGHFDFTSDEGRLAFIGEGAVILNIEDETVITARPAYRSYDSDWGGAIYWHEDEEWLLVFETGFIGARAYAPFYGVMSADGQIRRDLGENAEWLPSRVNPDNLPPVLPASAYPQPDHIIQDNQWNFYASWSPDGKQLAVGLDRWYGGTTPIHVWDLETETVETAFEDEPPTSIINWLEQDGNAIPQVGEQSPLEGDIQYGFISPAGYRVQAISPDGQFGVIWDGSENLSVYALNDHVLGDLVAQVPISSNSITAIAYSPDGRYLAFGSQRTPVEIWDTQTWTRLVRLPNGGAGLAFSPDGHTLAVTISWDIQLWDVEMLVGE